ncbi:hypothetical protein HELRODRAFT_68269, partial [Helobdella robusta]|uniref:BPTI/Kunitz inhibitor domain-containing protein n=1 Tax=Helobdella robusta TaxID=6412 RepID=T1FZC4_HELRO
EHCKEAYYAGPCLSFSSQYAFDLAVSDCVEFQYGGCAGRRNRFHSRTACLQECLHFNSTKSSSAYLS